MSLSLPGPGRRRRAIARGSLTVLLLAVSAYLLLALAEQGGVGSLLSPVPDSPLPFDRSAAVGLDLSDRSSIEALEWLESVDLEGVGLIAVAIDPEIVAAVTDEETSGEAVRAIGSLFNAAGDTPLAVCLRHPISSFSDQELAEAAVSVMQQHFTGEVAYLFACDPAVNTAWQDTLAIELTGVPIGRQLIPLTIGEPVTPQEIEDLSELERSHLRAFSGDRYILLSYSAARPLDEEFRNLATTAIDDAAQIALTLVRPDRELDPETFARSLTGIELTTENLPEGFTNIYSLPPDQVQGFESSTIGTVEYFRSTDTGNTVSVRFTGTALYALALTSPEGGTLQVWLDADDNYSSAPDISVDLSSVQANDAALPLVAGLPAARHQVLIVTDTGDISISGFFVSGRPESRWNGGLAAISLLITAAVALAIYSYLQIGEIRERYLAPPPEGSELGHPREFSRGD